MKSLDIFRIDEGETGGGETGEAGGDETGGGGAGEAGGDGVLVTSAGNSVGCRFAPGEVKGELEGSVGVKYVGISV